MATLQLINVWLVYEVVWFWGAKIKIILAKYSLKLFQEWPQQFLKFGQSSGALVVRDGRTDVHLMNYNNVTIQFLLLRPFYTVYYLSKPGAYYDNAEIRN